MGEWWSEFRGRGVKDALKAAERYATNEAAIEALIAAGGGLLHVSDPLTIPHAQIITMPSLGQTVVEAAGANTVIVPVLGLVKTNTAAGAYTLSSDASWMFMLGTQEVSGVAVMGAGVLSNPQIMMRLIPPDFGVSLSGTFGGALAGTSHTISDVANQPLKIKDDYGGVADYTDGNAANFAIVTAIYVVWNTTTGALIPA